MSKKKNKSLNVESTSNTPEMVPSMFNWLTPDIQAIKAEHLDKATKKS